MRLLIWIFMMVRLCLCTWKGYEYWNSRYGNDGISYTDWRGFWGETPRIGYKRVYPTSQSKTQGCEIKNEELSCIKSTKLKLTIQRQKTFTIIPESAFKPTVIQISIYNENLKDIHPNAFKTLTSLTYLKIVNSKLNQMPDLSGCTSLENLDLYSNQIQIYRHNYTFLPKSLKTINLIKNEIYKLPTGYFDLPNLKYVALGINQIKYFPSEAFASNISSLEYVGVDDNQIESVSQRDLSTIVRGQKFVHLNLSNNAISYIAPKALKMLRSLVILELHNNKIKELPEYTLWKVPKLVHLDMNHNDITILPSKFITDCPSLKFLALHSQTPKMEKVYFDSLKNLTRLSTILLGSNALTSFPHPVFSEEQWSSLSIIELDNNMIPSLRDYSSKDFPPSAQVHHLMKKEDFVPFKSLPSLTLLNLRNNLIAEIRETDLEYCRSLQTLNMQGNDLQESTIHEFAFQNTSIEKLDLSSQRLPGIQYVPKVFLNNRMPNLEEVDLQSNKITFIDSGTFLSLTKLSLLNLNNNQILTIGDNSFPPSLTSLFISQNQFRFTNHKQFRNLDKLDTLDLNENKIKVIPDDTFQGMSSLTKLEMQSNRIGRLKKDQFENTTNIKYFDVINNQVAFVEDGTFAKLRRHSDSKMDAIGLKSNKLSKIPYSDFWNIEIGFLKLDNNLITRIPSNGFVNFTCTILYLGQNRVERIKSYGFHNVDCTDVSIGGKLNVNSLQIIESHAYSNVKVYKLDLSYHFVKVLPQFAFKMRNLGWTIFINDGPMEMIETSAFDLGVVPGSIVLNDNELTTIRRKIFATGTKFKSLYMRRNKISSIDDYAFEGSSLNNEFRLDDNELTFFPAALKTYTQLKFLKVDKNKIASIPVGSLDNFVELRELSVTTCPYGNGKGTGKIITEVSNNKIQKLENNLFMKNSKFISLKIGGNKELTTIEDYTFNNTLKLTEVRAFGTAVEHIPKFHHNPDLFRVWFSDVQTVAPQFIGSANTPKLRSFGLDTTKMQCDCFWYDTITTFLRKSIRNKKIDKDIKCDAPHSLIGFTTSKNVADIEKRKSEFICVPMEIKLSAPADYTIRINYEFPPTYYPQGPKPDLVNDQIYTKTTCNIDDGSRPPLTGSVKNLKEIVISGENILPGRLHRCYLTLTYTDSKGSNHTSARSPKFSVTTVERKAKATLCANGDPYECQFKTTHATCVVDGCDVIASNDIQNASCTPLGCCTACYKSCIKCNNTVTEKIKIDIKYYDFRATDNDFNKLTYNPDQFDPKFIPSPYETWIGKSDVDMRTDTFSAWYRSSSSRNIPIDSILTLSSEGITDPVNSERLFTFWNNDYWAVNGKGFGAQGQKDCQGKELLNFGFTSAIRSAFRYTGKEHFQFAGGENVWVFINKVLVLKVVRTSGDTSPTQCKTFQLKNATGSGFVVPSAGEVDPKTKTCTNTKEIPEEIVSLKLTTNINYGLEVFHVERFPCKSKFLFAESGVEFITASDRASNEPVADYIFQPPEDATLKTIVGSILVSDLYETVPPYSVTIESGNEEERFEIQQNSTQAHIDSSVAPIQRVYENITLNGEVIIVCPNAVNSTASIPKTRNSLETFDNINTDYALILLKQGLDFEATPSYLLRLKVKDGDGREGHLIIQILVADRSDNCPIIQNKIVPHLTPEPPLQQAPLLSVQASDADSGENGRITYMVQEVSKIPKVQHKAYEVNDQSSGNSNQTRIVWVNTTVEYTVKVNVYAVDNGSPRRGDFFTISLSYSPSCDKRGNVVINESSGAVNFFAPGMTIFNKTKFRNGREECYECSAGYFCPGDSRESPCVQDEQSRHYYSYGFASKCVPCPEGWLCHKGIIIKCDPNTYVQCNDSWCPAKCFPCEPGTYCYEGIQQECGEGTFSDGKGPCQLCSPGSYSNTSRASKCDCCPSGYESTYAKNGCMECHFKEWSNDNCSICATCWPPGSCGCDQDPCFRGVACTNIGEKGQSFICGSCPRGSVGNGITCTDINECDENPCFNETYCNNISPGYHCSGCPLGFSGNAPSGVGLEDVRRKKQVCIDINECETTEHLCDPNAACINTPGSYYCGKCKPGFVGDGYVGCKSGDYCASGEHNCHINATCIPLGSQKFHCVCKDGYAGNGVQCTVDDDYDGIASNGAPCIEKECKKDNCVNVPNGGQEDFDEDTLGDVCDDDDDNDNIVDWQDNCQFKEGRNQSDADGDGAGNICDNCPSSNPDQRDTDGDMIGDKCDVDIDNDGLTNDVDNCDYLNTTQPDIDNDGVGDGCDNCYKNSNPGQADVDQSGFGDICNGTDSDKDSIPDDYDNCPHIANAGQANKDGDNQGDVCDSDKDNDGIADVEDNCIYVKNAEQNHTINYDMQANPVGLSCVDDYDGDGVEDKHDMCPFASNIHTTSFKVFTEVDLSDPSFNDPKPKWRIRNEGRDIEQLVTTNRPSILLGDDRYSDIEYSGVFHVNHDDGIDYIGIVFGYQNNKKFYVAMWRHKNMNYLNTTYKAGIKGIQIKVVDSDTGPGDALTQALWLSDDTPSQVSLLWQDPLMLPWKHHESYIFKLEFQGSLNRMRLKLQKGETVLTDSGYLYDTTITGGRLGVYTHGQGNVIWSRLTAKCLRRQNRALSFNGNNSRVALPSLNELKVELSFLFMVWVKIPAGDGIFPLLCNNNVQKTFCLFVQQRALQVKLSGTTLNTLNSGKTLSADTWYHIAMRYDGEGDCTRLTKTCLKKIVVLLNGEQIGFEVVSEYDLNYDDVLYAGYDGSNYYKGAMDEISAWNRYIPNDEIKEYMKLPGLSWPIHQHLVTAFYNIDQQKIGSILQDQSEYNNNANMTNIQFVESTIDYSRLQL